MQWRWCPSSYAMQKLGSKSSRPRVHRQTSVASREKQEPTHSAPNLREDTFSYHQDMSQHPFMLVEEQKLTKPKITLSTGFNTLYSYGAEKETDRPVTIGEGKENHTFKTQAYRGTQHLRLNY